MKRKIRLALLTAPLFSNNMGCNALTYASIEILSHVAVRLGCEFDFVLAGNPRDAILPDEWANHSIQLIEQVPRLGVRGFWGCAYRGELGRRRNWSRKLDSADLFLDIAAGDSFSDIYGPNRYRQVAGKFRYALQKHKPLILLPQTIGPFQSNTVRKHAAQLIRRAWALYARDPLSAECARSLVPGKPVVETVDMAFFLPCPDVAKPPGVNVRVGFNPSGLLWRGGYTRANQFGLKDDYPDLARLVIRRLLSNPHIEVELIGHDISGPNGGNRNDDYYVCKTLCREFPECRLGPFFYSPIEAKAHISGLDAFVGSRMHACIAAYSSGVPVLPLAYSRKFKGQFADKLNYRHGVDLGASSKEETAAMLEVFLEQRTAILAGFPVRLAELKRERIALEEQLARHIEQALS